MFTVMFSVSPTGTVEKKKQIKCNICHTLKHFLRPWVTEKDIDVHTVILTLAHTQTQLEAALKLLENELLTYY